MESEEESLAPIGPALPSIVDVDTDSNHSESLFDDPVIVGEVAGASGGTPLIQVEDETAVVIFDRRENEDTDNIVIEDDILIIEDDDVQMINVDTETDETESELQDLDDASDNQSEANSRPMTPHERPLNPHLVERPLTPRPLTPRPMSQSSHNVSMHDFQSPQKVKVSSLLLPGSKLVKEEPKENAVKEEEKEEEDSECCPICFESWSNSGSHRLCSLKCGHLFGQSCIEKWLKGQGSACPQCNAKAHRKDIRTIFAKTLRTVDTSERDRAIAELEKEKVKRAKAEMEAAQVRGRYQLAIDECNRMRQELERQRQHMELVKAQPVGGLPDVTRAQNNAGYHIERAVKIWEAGGCRVMAYAEHLATLCVSQPSASPLFPGFGIRKLSMLDFKTSQYVSIHTKAIRDIAFNPTMPDGILLSCSIDKTVKMTSLISNSVVQTYKCAFPLWCCAWNPNDLNYFYAGQQNGTVCVFDLRNTREHVRLINSEGSRAPVVSIQYMPSDPNAPLSHGGLLVGQLERTIFYEKIGEEYKYHMLSIDAALTSLSIDPDTRRVLTSHRPTARHAAVRHQVAQLQSAPVEDNQTEVDRTCRLGEVHTMFAGSTATLLSRSRLIHRPSTGDVRDDNSLLVVAPDEASHSVYVWDNYQIKQKIRLNAPVLDLCEINHQDCHYLAALTQKEVMFSRWT